MRRSTVIVLIAALLMLGGGAYALAGASSSPTPKAPAAQSSEAPDDAGVHGGPKARVHTGCTLASGLTGNWTHGDYVSTVAKAHPGDSAKIREAAHSNCGKVDHGAAAAARAKAKAARKP